MMIFTVQGMTCVHCVRAVTQAIQNEDQDAQVQIDLSKGEVRVQSELDTQRIVWLISEEGYAAQPA